MRRIALFLDGTWNKPDDNTNVWRLSTLLAARGDDDVQQLSYYETGVGTKWYDRIRGGAIGTGLTGKVKDAYEWLVRTYEDGDEIFIFGFSRGAYTARSLGGIISRCGLLVPGATTSVAEVFERYRSEQRGRAPETESVDITFIGVFDTVGALGIPGISRKKFRFLNANPSTTYKAMYHAVGIDENRMAYRSTLWTRWAPEGRDPDPLKPDQMLEQRWFVGVHSNVGGGYRADGLPSVPLAWMQQRAQHHGLAFKRDIVPSAAAHLGELTDSYAKFLGGVYRLTRGFRRYWRPIGAPGRSAPLRASGQPGCSYELNQVVDATVFERCRADASYRPSNLVDWAEREGLALVDTHGDVATGTWIATESGDGAPGGD